jgi:hypothetical protein
MENFLLILMLDHWWAISRISLTKRAKLASDQYANIDQMLVFRPAKATFFPQCTLQSINFLFSQDNRDPIRASLLFFRSRIDRKSVSCSNNFDGY